MDEDSRNKLEEIINEVIAKTQLRLIEIKIYATTLQIHNIAEFTYGALVDDILTRFAYYYTTKFPDEPSEHGMAEAWAVIAGRAREIREAITRAININL